VDRRADRLAIAAVVQGSRVGVVVAREFERETVEARGRDPWFDERTDQIERFRGQRAGLAHCGEVFGPVQTDLAAAAANLFVCQHKCRRRRHQRSFGPCFTSSDTYALPHAEDKSPIWDWERSTGLADFPGVHASVALGCGGFRLVRARATWR